MTMRWNPTSNVYFWRVFGLPTKVTALSCGSTCHLLVALQLNRAFVAEYNNIYVALDHFVQLTVGTTLGLFSLLASQIRVVQISAQYLVFLEIHPRCLWAHRLCILRLGSPDILGCEQWKKLPRSEFIVCHHGFINKTIVVMSKYARARLLFKINNQPCTFELLDNTNKETFDISTP